LLPQNITQQPTSRGKQYEPANPCLIFCRTQGHRPALAVPQEPDTISTGFPTDSPDPGMDIRRVIVKDDSVRVRHCCSAPKHPALVNANRANTPLHQAFSEEPIGI
jgi:hypothetical protein